MKSLAKPVILASMLSTFGLFCSFSNADEQMAMPLSPQSSDVQSQYFDTNTPQNINILPLRLNIYTTTVDKLPADIHKSCSSNKKKNEIYELSAIFNDKLQMFLSYFGDAPSYRPADLVEEDPRNIVRNNNKAY